MEALSFSIKVILDFLWQSPFVPQGRLNRDAIDPRKPTNHLFSSRASRPAAGPVARPAVTELRSVRERALLKFSLVIDSISIRAAGTP